MLEFVIAKTVADDGGESPGKDGGVEIAGGLSHCQTGDGGVVPKRSAILMLVVLVLVAGWAILGVERNPETKDEPVSPPAAPQGPTAVELHAARPSERESVTQTPVPVGEGIQPPGEATAPQERLWRARVVDGETQAPLAEARIAVLGDDPFAELDDAAWTPVRADGSVELVLASLARATLAVHCPGHAFAYVLTRADDAEPNRPRLVELWREVTVAVRVRDERSLQIEPATVEILVEDSDLFTGNGFRSWGQEFAWEGRLTEDGVLVFEGLPSYKELVLEAVAGETKLHHELLFLAPGKREEREIFLRDGCAIAGRALTPEGEPVAELEVWLVGQLRLPGRYFQEFEEILERATTDARGEFTFADVAPGTWFVGPANRKEFDAPEATESAARDHIAPMAERVTLPPGAGVVRVTLTCWSGLYIHGSVFDSSHRPDGRAYLSVVGTELMSDGQVKSDGTFTAGPLVPGEYTLVASVFEGTDSPSEPVKARPGDEKVEVRLRPGGSVIAVVLDEQGGPATGVSMALISAEDEYEGRGSMETDADGRVAFTGVEPGRYALIAERGLSTGLCLVSVEKSGAAEGEARMSLGQGVTVIVACPAKRQLGYRVRYAGWMVDTGFFAPGEEPSIVAPAGDIAVELLSWDKGGEIGVAETRTVTAGAGERIRLEFDAPGAPR